MLTVLTWFWQQPGGRTDYQPTHVRIWADMVRRHLTLPHRLAVVTDVPGDYGHIDVISPPGDFEDVRIPTWGEHMPQCLRRLAMFRPDAASIFGERFVSMDMDCVISGSLDPLFDRLEDFVMYRGTTKARPYNGSMVMMTAGARPQVYEQFTQDGAIAAGHRFLGSDQAWISHVLGPGEAVWDAADGVHAWSSRHNIGDPRVTFFLQAIKPWEYVDAGEPFICENYRRDGRPGRCLVLGYGETLWPDVEAALDTGPFDTVIASPEAAEYWPKPVDHIAIDDGHAERLARMHGFTDVTHCGRQPERAAA